MAVKKAKQNVEVEETVDVAVDETKEEVVADVSEDEVKVDVSEEKDKSSDEDSVTVDTEAFTVNEVNIPEEKEKKVRIRMRTDHHCTIAMVRYDLKAGKTYDVPANVKKILDKAGLLSPL